MSGPEQPGILSEEQRRQASADDADLRRLGYRQQLFREMGGFSNFAISFSIISVLTGAVLLYGYGLKFAGPIINTVGWPVASLFTLCVAASMAELASAYPTAGGLYFWAFRLGGRTWAWVTAWLNMIGQVAATAGINSAAAIYLIGAVTRIAGLPSDAEISLMGATFPLTNWYFQVAVMTLLMAPQVWINCRGIRLTARLNDFSVYWHIAGGAIIVGLLCFLGKHHNSLAFLFSSEGSVNPLDASSAEISGQTVPALTVGEYRVPSPLFAMVPGLTGLYQAAPFALVGVLALLQAQWTYTGYDASAHVAEETLMARKNSAWGIVLSVAVSGVVGYLLLLALTWCIPNADAAATASDAYPVLQIAYGNLAGPLAHVVALIIGVAMWLCGCSSISSMGRMWYAFARDEGLPGSALWKQVDPASHTPRAAILLTSVLAVVLCLYAAAFTVVSSISTIALYLAYGIPVYLNRRNRRRGDGEWVTPALAPWNLGRWSPLIGGVAIGYTLFICVVFLLPPNELVLWTSLAMGLLLTAYWKLHASRRFSGPTPADEVELRTLEQEADA